MANAIAEIFVTLGLDASDFQKGMNNADKQMQGIGDRASKVGEELRKGLGLAFSDVIKAAFPLLGVTGAINALAGAQKGLYSVMKASKETGIPAEQYAAWGRAAENLGYSAEDAQGALAGLQSSLQEAALTGRSQAAGVLTYLGVSLFKANGQMKSSVEVLRDLSGVLSKMPVEKARIYGQMMGISPSTVALLREGKNLTEELAKQLEAGPTKEQAQRAWEVQKAWNQLSQSGGDLARELLVTLSPAIIKVFDVVKELSQFLSQNHELVLFAGGAIVAAKSFTTLATAFTVAGKAGAAALTLIGTAAKANPLLLGLTAIVAALYSISKWFKGESSVVGSVLESIGIKAENLKAIFQAIGKVLSIIFAPLAIVANLLGSILNKVFDEDEAQVTFDDAKKSKVISNQNSEKKDENRDRIVKKDKPRPEIRAESVQKAQVTFEDAKKWKEMTDGMRGNVIVAQAREVQAPPSIINNRNTSGTVNSQVHNEVTINAPNGNAGEIKKAVQSGIQSGMSGFDRSLITFQESGFISK